MKKANKDKMVKKSTSKGGLTVQSPFQFKGIKYDKGSKISLSKDEKERLKDYVK